jgi:muramidase (phage lysozyme)
VPLIHPSDSDPAQPAFGSPAKSPPIRWFSNLLVFAALLGLGGLVFRPQSRPFDPTWGMTPPPLVMQGGDPHLRALMRTISVAESNVPRPYSVLYGGEQIQDLSRHPDRCVTIVNGPNQGNCSTAAGRYQFITTTWLEKAADYHPKPGGFWFVQNFSFAPEYQDQVVYRWLNDSQAWGVDLVELLQQDRLGEVLEILSPTWTSLGYGIEPNSMTDHLPQIYRQLLAEELRQARSYGL